MGNPHQGLGVFGRFRRQRSRNSAKAPSFHPNSALSYRVDQATDLVDSAPIERVRELDALRGIACLTILIYHFKSSIVPFGWTAVDLFFVLSGYLITTILIKHQTAPGFLRTFYIRRGLRILPIYYLAILALIALGPWLPSPTRGEGIFWYLTYLQNTPLYWADRAPEFSPYTAHLWTLANEEQFYLLWPLILAFVGKRGVIPAAVVLAGVSLVARARGVDTWLLLPRADGFALGGLLAAILYDRTVVVQRRRVYRGGLISIGLFSLAFLGIVVSRGWLPSFGRPPLGAPFSVLAINLVFFSVVGLVATHAGSPGLGWLRRRSFVWLGTVSYGLYLYHFIALMLGADILTLVRGRGRSPLTDLALMGVSFLMAWASWKWIEKPILSLKARFPYEGTPSRPSLETLRPTTFVCAEES